MTDEGSARRRRWLVPGVLALLGIGAAAAVVRQNRIEAARDPWLDPIPAPTPIRSLRPSTTPIGGDGAALNGTASLNGTETTAVRPAPSADRAEPAPSAGRAEPEPDAVRDTAEDEVPAPDAAARTTPDPDASGATDAARGTGAVVGTDAARDPDAEGDTGTGSGAAATPGLLGDAEPASAESPPSEAADRTQAGADETLADGDHATPGVRMSEPEPTAESPASTEPASERLAAGDAAGAAPTGKHAAEGPAAGRSAADRAGAAKHAASESDAPGSDGSDAPAADEPGSLFEPAPGTPAATPTPPERSLKPVEAPSEAIAEAPYGAGSALPLDSGEAPSPAYTIKGSAGSKRFHGPTSPYYARTRAEVWFTTPEAAEAAGFTSYKAKRRDGE